MAISQAVKRKWASIGLIVRKLIKIIKQGGGFHEDLAYRRLNHSLDQD
jgi:hypothetical protein